MPTKRHLKVAIVGGGCAGLAAAWELLRSAGYEYEIHVYERSWRLGGKGASGRDADGRILEHGLHIWLGFYENAFRMMRECYGKVEDRNWGPQKGASMPLPHGSLADAFFPEPHIGVALRGGDERAGDWSVWSGYLPPAKGMPGEDLDGDSNPFTLWNYLLRCYELLKTLVLSDIGPADGPLPGRPDAKQRSALARMDLKYAYDPGRTDDDIVAWSARLLRASVLTGAGVLVQAVGFVEALLQRLDDTPMGSYRTFQLITAVLAQARKLLVDVTATDPHLARKVEIVELVITIAVGLFQDRVLFDDAGLDAINHCDYREWLRKHGASDAVLRSEFLTGIYDLTFAYAKGDKNKPQLAAGVALRGALRMFFTYRGSMFWRMRSGMGDAVFAPLYRALDDAGVKFHFLHALDTWTMKQGPGGLYVDSLTFTAQGDPAMLDASAGKALDAFGCWPDDRRLFAAAGTTPTTVPETAFDAVIFAMGADDFVAAVGRCNFAREPQSWTNMRKSIATIATQSVQVWLGEDLQSLGWHRASGIITAAQPPFETWADMTHTLATEEAWRTATGVASSPYAKARTVAYFCGVLPDAKRRGREALVPPAALVQRNLQGLLTGGLAQLWPAAFRGSRTAATFTIGSPHVQVNAVGSERYTLSLPGTIKYRISPLDRSVLNMTIAGDWTANGLDAGCVEGAVMSGMLAAYAISNDAKVLDRIVGYDHP